MSNTIRFRCLALLFCAVALAAAYHKTRTEAMMLDFDGKLRTMERYHFAIFGKPTPTGVWGKQAIFPEIAPYDLIALATVRAKLDGDPQGLPASKMNDRQSDHGAAVANLAGGF